MSDLGRGKLPMFLVEAFLFYAFLIRGVLPALTTIDTDFPNYYTAGRLVLTGGQVSRLYDDAWFQEQIYSEGIHQQGKFSPFPPVTALVSAPLGLFSPLTALRIATIVNLLALALSVMFLSRLAELSLNSSLILVLLSGIGLANCLRFGQAYILLSLSMILGLFFYKSHRPLLAGMLFGLWIPVKYFPAILLVYFVIKREWRVVFAAVVTAAAVTAGSIAVLGWELHKEYLYSVLGGHLAGELTLQSPFSPVFQSFSSLYHSLFLQDPALHPHALLPSSLAYWIFTWLTLWAIVAFMARAMIRVRRNLIGGGLAVSVLTVGALLAAPATATYHGVLLWAGAGLLWKELGEKEEQWPRVIFAALYATMGFLPYSIFLRFYDDGALIILAYPRLLILAAMFAILLTLSTRAGAAEDGLQSPFATP